MYQPETQIDFPPPKFNWKNARIVGIVMAVLIAAAGIYSTRQDDPVEKKTKPLGTASLLVRTTPIGASIRINNEVKCTSDCTLELTEGEHQIQAFLPGFEPRASTVNLSAGVPLAIDLVLEPQTLSVRFFTDLPSGRVMLDGRAVGLLKDGQFGLDRVSPGKHKLRLISAKGASEFEFESSPGNAPQLVAPIAAADLFAFVIGHANGKGEVYTNEQPLKVQMEDSAMGEVGPLGLELHNLQRGDRAFVVGEGKRQRTFMVPLGAQPSLMVFVRLDPNAGSLLVIANEDGATVYLNNYEYWRKIKDGQLKIENLPVGPIAIRVAKWQFDVEPFSVKTEIRKGEELKIDFKLNTASARPAVPSPQPTPPATIIIPGPSATPTPPGPVPTALPKMEDPFLSLWEDQTNWAMHDGWHTKKGGNFIFLRRSPVHGTVRFSLAPVNGHKAQWIANFRNSQNFVLYSIDGKNFTRKEFVDGKTSEVRIPHELTRQDTFTIQIKIAHASITHELFNGVVWRKIDSLTSTDRNLANGRFALYLPGVDMMGVANFMVEP